MQHSTQIKRDSLASLSSDNSSPVYKLKALANSPLATDAALSTSKPLPLFKGKAPVPVKREGALEEPGDLSPEHCFKEEDVLLPDVIDKSRKDESQH